MECFMNSTLVCLTRFGISYSIYMKLKEKDIELIDFFAKDNVKINNLSKLVLNRCYASISKLLNIIEWLSIENIFFKTEILSIKKSELELLDFFFKKITNVDMEDNEYLSEILQNKSLLIVNGLTKQKEINSDSLMFKEIMSKRKFLTLHPSKRVEEKVIDCNSTSIERKNELNAHAMKKKLHNIEKPMGILLLLNFGVSKKIVNQLQEKHIELVDIFSSTFLDDFDINKKKLKFIQVELIKHLDDNIFDCPIMLNCPLSFKDITEKYISINLISEHTKTGELELTETSKRKLETKISEYYQRLKMDNCFYQERLNWKLFKDFLKNPRRHKSEIEDSISFNKLLNKGLIIREEATNYYILNYKIVNN